jgi:hypothetical protein
MMGLLSIIGYGVARLHQQLIVPGSDSAQAAAWEVVAAMPAMVALLHDSLGPLADDERQNWYSNLSFNKKCALVCQMLQLLVAAEPLQLPSYKYVAPWAAAADASLRLLPALVEQRGGDEPMLLASLSAELLWDEGCDAIHIIKTASKDIWASSTAQYKACWAAALQPLVAAHARVCRLVHWLRVQPDGGASLLAALLPPQSSCWQRLTRLLVNHWINPFHAARAAHSRELHARCA